MCVVGQNCPLKTLPGSMLWLYMERITSSFHSKRLSCWGLEQVCFNMDDLCRHKSLACRNVSTKSETNKGKDTRRESSVTVNTNVGVTMHYRRQGSSHRIWKWTYPALELEEKTPSLRLLVSKLPGNIFWLFSVSLFVVICSNSSKNLINKEYRYIQ